MKEEATGPAPLEEMGRPNDERGFVEGRRPGVRRGLDGRVENNACTESGFAEVEISGARIV